MNWTAFFIMLCGALSFALFFATIWLFVTEDGVKALISITLAAILLALAVGLA